MVVLPGRDEPTVLAVAGFADLRPTAPGPAPDESEPTQLALSIGGVRFPNYAATRGWRPSGYRADELDSRETRTVYYRRGRQRIAYTIVSGEPLGWPTQARASGRLRHLTRGGRTIVTWLRGGRTCVLSATGLPRGELLQLAAWDGVPLSR